MFSRFHRRLSSAHLAAVLALLVALGGGAYALASSGGGKITVCVRHKGGALYKAHKCARHDRKLSWNKKGPKGATGPRGIRGRQGPGGSVLTYDAKASATPKMTTLGTVLGDTLSVECALDSGHVATQLFIHTSDGSLKMDFANSLLSGSVVVARFNIPSGTLTTPNKIDEAKSPNVESQLQATQIGPSPGVVTWHLTADDPAQTCHVSIMSFPTTVRAVATSGAARSARTHLPLTTTRKSVSPAKK